MTPGVRSGQAGFTLIEVLISVALFALIGLAGFAIVQSMIDVQRRTEGRLAQLGERQRAMHILTTDFEQARPGSLGFDGTTLTLHRSSGSDGGGDIAIAYDVSDGTLRRIIAPASGPDRTQILLAGIKGAVWQFYRPASGWTAAPGEDGPLAVAVDLTLAADTGGRTGTLRRVVTLLHAAPQ